MRRLHDDEIKLAGCLVCGRLTLENAVPLPPGAVSEDPHYAYMHDACISKSLKEMQKLALEKGTPMMLYLGKVAAELDTTSFRRN